MCHLRWLEVTFLPDPVQVKDGHIWDRYLHRPSEVGTGRGSRVKMIKSQKPRTVRSIFPKVSRSAASAEILQHTVQDLVYVLDPGHRAVTRVLNWPDAVSNFPPHDLRPKSHSRLFQKRFNMELPYGCLS
ncbi:predicted protein [Histoplasma capsulatum G186AR]|uniref:Uncharacterized protein n=1 Tax=Ajellomyces capsulatus (strain G186AR / H82 / ATCC MYA-2454 / RMSCC 2432) TaxID=447093 RepID=C0NUB1_AJECG|nr:uncharacterized protein HCBG_06942 [Histoplasma capsulatum G186AR]EEH04991.1 predicted protein [Histoplasma capsulatum G186AR]